MLTKQQEIEYAQIVAKSWLDADFRKKLIANPKDVLNAHGFHIPDSVSVSINEGSNDGKIEFGLPPRPPNISDDDLNQIVVSARGCF